MRLVILLTVLLGSCGHGGKEVGWYDPKRFPPPPNEIVLGVGDVIEVNVWEQKDLSSETTVRPDGTITMPLVGDVQARGKTPSALRADIKKQLERFLKLEAGNEVTVKVKQFNSYRFTVNGEVSRPGMFTSADYLRVADAIALAGGPTRFAKRNAVVILRTNGATREQMSIPIDFDLVASGKRPDMNIWIHANDVIYMP